MITYKNISKYLNTSKQMSMNGTNMMSPMDENDDGTLQMVTRNNPTDVESCNRFRNGCLNGIRYPSCNENATNITENQRILKTVLITNVLRTTTSKVR